MNRRLALLLFALLTVSPLLAQEEMVFETDTLLVAPKKGMINDYSLIGVNFGPTISRMFFNPNVKQDWLYNPYYMSVTYIKNMKMFGFLPYFGFQVGLAYGHEGYRFVENKETGYIHTIEGATEARIDVFEIPFLLHGHVDGQHFKVMLNAGPYVAYRNSITRTGQRVPESLVNNFADSDYRWDYGVYGGIGFALIFDPVELHFNAMGHAWSWGSLYAPDSTPSEYNKYYYRYAYPLDINFTAGIYFQLGKRTGRTSRQLKKEAFKIVYGDEKDYGQDK